MEKDNVGLLYKIYVVQERKRRMTHKKINTTGFLKVESEKQK